MSIVPPTIRPPTAEEVKKTAAMHHLTISDDEVEEFVEVLANMVTNWERLDELSEPSRTYRYTDRNPGYQPEQDEDPYNASVTKCRVQGAPDGPLKSYTVGLKDNIPVAGVEMTCGSRVFRGYVPRIDATIVTRLLDSGATITAKLNMEDMAISSTGDQSATGPVLNPRDPTRLAGGSSSGSAVAVVTGDVDIAIGTDQAGSIRMPAAINGCVGLKPTFGLVPYTGIVEVAPTIDHAGPMAMTVEKCALALNVLAGEDPVDPRQCRIETDDYIDVLSEDVTELTVGVLKEGFEWELSDQRVDETVHESLNQFETAGVSLREVSVPYHLDGTIIRNAITTEAHTALTNGEGIGHYLNRYYDTQFSEAFGKARRVHADDFPLNYKLRLILGQYLADEYMGYYYAKAQNLRDELTRAYDAVFSQVDVLALPTVPRVALELKEDLTRTDYLNRKSGMILNTSPFNVTGHPAISVPCGTVDGLPVGLMMVGKRFDDATVLQAAHSFEQEVEIELDVSEI